MDLALNNIQWLICPITQPTNIYIYMYVYIYIYIYTCIHTYICMYIDAYIIFQSIHIYLLINLQSFLLRCSTRLHEWGTQ